MNDNVEENKGTMKERESIAGTRGGGNVFLLKFFRQELMFLMINWGDVGSSKLFSAPILWVNISQIFHSWAVLQTGEFFSVIST